MTTPMVVGLSYRTAPLALLERVSLGLAGGRDLERRLRQGEHLDEAMVVSTCNRLEVYAAASRFHGGLAEIGAELARAAGVPLAELTDHVYVHYDAAAVEHLFRVAAGLDSMAVGEQQILGQVRAALRGAQESGGAGSVLINLVQQALRVGKRVHTETGLGRAGASLVQAGLERAEQVLGPLTGAHAVVLGAGAMSGLAVATLARAGVGSPTVVNRTTSRAARLAAASGGRARPLAELPAALAEADLVLACAGAPGYLVGAAAAAEALRVRGGRPQVYLDLALPRDVDPAVDALDGATLVDLAALGEYLATLPVGAEIERARTVVADEVQGYLTLVSIAQVAPTVVALRTMAKDVVDTELDRLRARLGADVDPRVLAECEQAVHRVVDKLLHTPTVRVKQLAAEPEGPTYAAALRELFDLDLSQVVAVTGRGGAP